MLTSAILRQIVAHFGINDHPKLFRGGVQGVANIRCYQRRSGMHHRDHK